MAYTTAPLFLVEITVWDPGLSATKVLRYATGQGFVTKPSETPASTFYDARVKKAMDIDRTMFSGRSTMGRSTVGVGDLILDNADGALDALVDYGFDGQSIVVRRATKLNPSYPADFTSYTLTALNAEFTSSEVRIALRDRQQVLASTPFQTTKYAGDNSLPSGLEGVATDLKGKPKPVCYGVVKNVPAPCVNTSKLIYQVNDGLIDSVDDVYDSGVSLSTGYQWTQQTSIPSGAGNCAAFGNGLFVVAGDAGELRTSPDGVTWTSRTSGFGATSISAVAYGGGTWVIVGGSHKIATSTDGITWTMVTNSVTGGINCIAFGAGVFVIGTTTAEIWTSPDGATWTNRTSPFGTPLGVAAVAFGNGVFMAAGGSGIGGTYYIATSADGTTWGLNSTKVPAQPYSVGYGEGVFYIGYNSSGAGKVLATSDNGASFIQRSTGVLVIVYSWAYGNGRILAGGLLDSADFPTSIAASPDGGKTWVAAAANIPANGLAFGNDTFVACTNSFIYSTAVPGTYGSLSSLLNDALAPAPGTFKYFADADGSYFRLGSRPVGIITADVSEGSTVAARTHAQIFKNTVLRCSAFSGSDVSSSDITALDSADSSVAGIWTGPDDDSSCADIADRIAQSCGAGWWNDSTGLFRIARLVAPSGSAALSLTPNDFKRPLERITPSDQGAGIPTYKVTLRYGRYYQTITTDLASGVDDASRAAFAHEWRDTTDSDSTVLTAHPLSQPLVIESLYANASDAATEATRVLTLRKIQRGFYEIVTELNADTASLDIGNVIGLINARFGMSVVGDTAQTYTGLFRVLDVRPNATAKELTLVVWGRPTVRNRITKDGSYRVTSTGVYRITSAEA